MNNNSNNATTSTSTINIIRITYNYCDSIKSKQKQTLDFWSNTLITELQLIKLILLTSMLLLFKYYFWCDGVNWMPILNSYLTKSYLSAYFQALNPRPDE